MNPTPYLSMASCGHPSPLLPLQQETESTDRKRRKPCVEDDWRSSITSKKMRLLNHTELYSIHPKEHRSVKTSELRPPGFDPLPSASNGYKNPNWRLACFLAREYLQSGTLLGKAWPGRDSNKRPPDSASTQAKKNLEGDEAAMEHEALYATFTTNFLRSDDIQIPGIFNPSQVAAWLGFK